MDGHNFNGAKLVLMAGDKLVTILRDNRPDIPWPDMWDLPGGGREGNESPETCVLRETHEELGLDLDPDVLTWRCSFPNLLDATQRSWWFGAQMPLEITEMISFGDEGQGWRLACPQEWLDDPCVIPTFKPRLRQALLALGV